MIFRHLSFVGWQPAGTADSDHILKRSRPLFHFGAMTLRRKGKAERLWFKSLYHNLLSKQEFSYHIFGYIRRKGRPILQKGKGVFWGWLSRYKIFSYSDLLWRRLLSHPFAAFCEKTVHWTNLSIHLKAWRHINFIFLFFFRTC